LLVDGQHRMSALYQALRSGGGVALQDAEGRTTSRSYFIDMELATNPASDRDDAMVSVGEAMEGGPELREGLFPLWLTFGGDSGPAANAERTAATAMKSRWAHAAEWGQSPATTERAAANQDVRDRLARRFEAEVFRAFDDYMVPAILFPKEWTRWTVRMRGGARGRALSDELGIPRGGEVQ
jgi:hypothetical protein